jgi:hypothetical protein
VHGQDGLLLDALDRHEAHVRPAHCLADRLGIGRIVLVRLDVGLDELRRHQPDRMPEALERAAPVMGARTRFHADQARRQVPEERCQLLTPELPAQHGLASRINPVHLKHVLRQINTDGCNIHGGRSHPR